MATNKPRRDEAAASAAGKGGDVTFTPAAGGVDAEGLRARDGDVVFRLADGTEMLRLCGDGRVFVRGAQVDDDREVYVAFRAWLAGATGLALNVR